ncbi:hypothetical protein O181_025053 [Austropuccinia psidii MF-1]|uniref:Uncharacterized protein n=1 Tax=Austropuccinia psidii MF-1 TaxID=1389203 RepID=A0A9Q3CLY8_9BASI|nr:hypothetical protein [Austropuccinia psidii MF-1]
MALTLEVLIDIPKAGSPESNFVGEELPVFMFLKPTEGTSANEIKAEAFTFPYYWHDDLIFTLPVFVRQGEVREICSFNPPGSGEDKKIPKEGGLRGNITNLGIGGFASM